MLTRDDIIEISRKAIMDNDQFDMGRLVAPLKAAGIAPVVLDIGANVGWWTLKLLEHWPEARVICYEPIPQNIQQIPQDERIETVMACVDIAPGTRTLFRQTGAVHKSHENDTMWSCLETYKGPVTGKCECSCVSFRGELARHEEIAIVKLDVEGHEAELLGNLEAEDIRHVFCFVVEGHLNYFGTHRDHVLEKAGMRLWYRVPGSFVFLTEAIHTHADSLLIARKP